MARMGMAIDLKRCIGCNACTVACKVENGTPEGVFFTKVFEHEMGTYPAVKKRFVPALCNHCADAPCVATCPTGATHQRPDGIVLVDYNVCMGCRACVVACPYQNRSFIPEGHLQRGYYGEKTPYEEVKYAALQEGVVVKCTFCAHRVDQGLEPACVVTCPAGARIFGDLEDPESNVSRQIRARNGNQPLAELGTNPSVFYLEG